MVSDTDSEVGTESSDRQLLADGGTASSATAFCTECGSEIDATAEICPDCGVRQIEEEPSGGAGSGEMSGVRKAELQQRAAKSGAGAALLGFFLGPVGYIYVGKWFWAAVCFFTLNYFLLGLIITPIHCYKLVNDAEKELAAHGEV